MVSRRLMTVLAYGAVALPIALCVMLGASALLQGLGDHAGGLLIARGILAVGVLWGIDLISLLVCLAFNTVSPPTDNSPPDDIELR